jgi:two-component system alkaline phosphatase synthesis response regulator PhoP
MYAYHIVLIEDSAGLAAIVTTVLEASGYKVIWYQSLSQWQEAFPPLHPQLIILDAAFLNDEHIVLLTDRLEAQFSLVLLLASHAQDLTRATEVALPPDDYLIKPFGMAELRLRVRSLLRRTPLANTASPRAALHHGVFSLDTDTHTLSVAGEEVALTIIEYKVMRLLLGQPKRVFSREELENQAWGVDYIGEDRAVDHLLSRLRRKLGSNGKDIETIRGVGYRLR